MSNAVLGVAGGTIVDDISSMLEDGDAIMTEVGAVRDTQQPQQEGTAFQSTNTETEESVSGSEKGENNIGQRPSTLIANDGMTMGVGGVDGSGNAGSDIRSTSVTLTAPPAICLCQQPQRIPRPRNAFILFRQHHHAKVVEQNPGKSNPEVSKVIGEMWRDSSPEDKAIWQKHADNEKKQHLARYPEYRYQPRRNPSKRGASGSAISASLASELAVCPNCGGRTSLSVPQTPATPMSAVPRNMRPSIASQTPPTPRASSSLSIPKTPNTSTPARPRKKTKDQDTASQTPKPSVEPPAQQLRSRNASEDQSTSLPSPIGQPPKKRKINPLFPAPLPTAMFREVLQTPGLPTSFGLDMDPFLHTSDLLRTGPFPDHDTSVTVMEQQMAMQNHGYEGAEYSNENSMRNFTVFDKIQAIRKVCKPLPALPMQDAQLRGPIIAIEGEDEDAVKLLVIGLAENLKRERVAVEVVEQNDETDSESDGNELNDPDAFRAGILEGVVKWHRISSNIKSTVQRSQLLGHNRDQENSTANDASQFSNALLPSSSSEPGLSKVPIVLLNRYILSRVDADAEKLTSMCDDDDFAPFQHWQWAANLWRGCVGPDMTIIVKTVAPNSGLGSGEQVEMFDDSRVAIVRKVQGRSWGEKTIRRIGFEVIEWVRILQGFS